MFRFINRIFGKPVQRNLPPFESPRLPCDPVLPPEVEANPMMREVMIREIRSGNVDDDGNVSIEEVAG